MGGIDKNEWTPFFVPNGNFSGIFTEELGSRSLSDLLSENGSQVPVDSNFEKDGNGVSQKILRDSYGFSCFQPNEEESRSSFMGRLAARTGVSISKINVSNIRSNDPFSSPGVRSPYLMIPPGLSPTTLLESPVLLSNSTAQPSPTTGTFLFSSFGHGSPVSISAAPDSNTDQLFGDADTSSFAFKSHVNSDSTNLSGGNQLVHQASSSSKQQQSFPSIDLSVQPEVPIQPQKSVLTEVESQNQERLSYHGEFVKQSTTTADSIISSSKPEVPSQINESPECSLLQTQAPISILESITEEPQNGEEEQKASIAPIVFGPLSDDGYNWRKYGQKQVKGSEFPRSYYKCTHPGCQVKKKVERSHDGQITEIIYKGGHEHPKPQPNRRSSVGSSIPLNETSSEMPEGHLALVSADGESVWKSNQLGANTIGNDWKGDGIERMSTNSLVSEYCDVSSSSQAQTCSHLELADPPELSSSFSDDEDDGDTHGGMPLGDDGEDDESEAKRRKKDVCTMDVSAASRSIREPRVVVQTTSEVDILDDGYRWRKYGQKVVKGNPNPRSYYKCTNTGCSVRKHVERASHDKKAVITTYEGKHNHDVPTARNSSHSGSTGAPPTSGGPTASPSAQAHILKPEPAQAHTSMALPPPPKVGQLHTTSSLGAFGQLGPDPGFSMMSQHGFSNLTWARLGIVPVPPLNSSYINGGGQQPKSEIKEETGFDSGMPMLNGSGYQQMMRRYQLGPHM
ncbi:probable WRKY transcription factor 2 [Amborella trichopoda]|uniref:WRKY domain-containing protein n=1 Tax=Amborella trichopoda TaxID=13333 RepID=U5D979_AMBTC|nr:probable WRKY transcription factor 2 [Amborella trichopoda]ERN19019.1 hypothetical protein AMTR_s00061p00050690 [Amborella trichopoda]|eukprot:XP_006857552.1 probable WRKY transcription factor 2 [Amborella trichopoda]